MASGPRYKYATPSKSKRQLWQEATKENITHLLDEFCFVDTDDPF